MKIFALILIGTVMISIENHFISSRNVHAPTPLKIITTDSTLLFSELAISKHHTTNSITSSKAKAELYKYFKNKNYCIEASDLEVSDLLCVHFDTMYPINLNSDQYQDAIICYWLSPPAASGNCYQPHHAMLISKGSNYTIIHEDFISDTYFIDSVSQGKETKIYSVEYNCGSHEYIRQVIFTLK